MAFKQVNSLDADVTVSLGKKDKKTGKPFPKTAEGYYLGSREVKTNLGPSTLHFLQTPKGNLGVWGGTDMNKKLGTVAPGTMVRITAAGQRPTPRGAMNVFKVEEDQNNTITVNVSASQPAAESDDAGYGAEDDGGSYGGSDEDDGGGTEDYTAPASQGGGTPALSAAERKAKVDALLNKNNRK
jgi:hypothetical protein